MPAAGYARADLAAILAIDTGTLVDKTSLLAEAEGGWFILDLQATTGGNTPTTGSGRWFRVTATGLKTLVEATLATSPSYAGGSTTDIVFDNEITDVDAAFNTTTGVYTVPRDMEIKVKTSIRRQTGTNPEFNFKVERDTGSGYSQFANYNTGDLTGVTAPSAYISRTIEVSSGDLIKPTLFSTSSAMTLVTSDVSYIQIFEKF